MGEVDVCKTYYVEVLPPKQNSETLEEDLERFAQKWQMVMEAGYIACVTDNAMGTLAFQGTELIEELDLEVRPGQVHIHLNTFHTKDNLDEILVACRRHGIEDLLLVTGDGNERLPKLEPAAIGAEVETVTAVQLLEYVRREYPETFNTGVAFNPYEPDEHEFEKLERKIEAGAQFVITQPLLGRNESVDRMRRQFGLPTVIEAWMSKKVQLLSECVGYEIAEDLAYDPLAMLEELLEVYPHCGVYLALLGYKSQFPLLPEVWHRARDGGQPVDVSETV
jgi:methylenetetrahydrofolate reductase (NADPH)